MIFVFWLLTAMPCQANDDPANELVEEMQKAQAQVESVLSKIKEKVPEPSIEKASIEKIRAKIITLASDDTFLSAVGDLWRHEKKNLVLLVNLFVFVLMILLKAWRQSKASNWFTKLITGFVFSSITWLLMVGLVPLIIFGQPYRVLFTTIWRVVFS